MLEWEHSTILPNFIKLPFAIKIFVLSVFESPFYTGFTVRLFSMTRRRKSQMVQEFEWCQYLPNLSEEKIFYMIYMVSKY